MYECESYMWLFMHVWMRVCGGQRTTLVAIHLSLACPELTNLGESDLGDSVSQAWDNKHKRTPWILGQNS